MRAILIALTLFVGLSSPAVAVDSTVSVKTAQLVHPVLIRNPRNGVLQVVITVAGKKPVALKSISFQMKGTTDISDIKSLKLIATAANRVRLVTRSSQPGLAISKPVKPAQEITIAAKHQLKPGANSIWLSCRLNKKASLSHRVGAVCTKVTTSAGAVAVKKNPTTGHRIGVALRRHRDDKVHTYRIACLTTTNSGTLLSAYDMRRDKGRDLQENIDIGLSRSTDGGQTWERVRVIMDMGTYGGFPQSQNGVSDPGIIVDRKTGEIFCFAVWMTGKPGKHQWSGDGSEPGFKIGKTAQFLMVSSKDDGKTWSKPKNLTRKLKKKAWWLYAPSPQQGFTLADGTLVMPSQGRNEKGKEFSTIMISRDHGASWQVGNPAYLGGSECQAVLLDDGSIMLNMRNERGRYRAVYTTRDFGKTWKPHVSNRKALIEPNCNGSLIRVDYKEGGQKKHVLIFANPHTQRGRTHHTIQVSFDDGKSWPKSHHLLLDDGLGAGYPSLTQVDKKSIGIVYEGSQSHLVYEKVSLKRLLRGK